MRDYAKLSPKFWTGKTGRALKRRGIEGVVVALYLVSSPHSNMLGLFHQPVLYIAEETGLSIEGASKGLDDCIACGFCSYDETSKTVWVHEMAAWQIADSLAPKDLRCKGIQKDYDALDDNPFLGPWFDRYAGAFNLTRRREFEGEIINRIVGAYEAPTKPLRSQEQEQEQEQENPQTPLRGIYAATGGKSGARRKSDDKPLGVPELVSEGVPEQVAADWLRVRRAKNAPLTPTAWEAVKREAAKASMTPGQAVKEAVERNWQGFKADWLAPQQAAARAGASPGAARDVFEGAV